nr:NEDD8-activating enzyme E1 catalytic subunit [Paratrimastix eleionoma]
MTEVETPEDFERERWDAIYKLFEKTSSMTRPDFVPGDENKETLHSFKVLVVGAGGLGCEILKDLALSGFRHIDVIDMDYIDISNLNRQFLFLAKDVGRPKSVVAAEFVNNRVEGVAVTAHNGDIKNQPRSFYAGFDLVISGLDSIDARRWLNSLLVSLAEEGTLIPFIDGGSEGFGGQARVILPTCNACFECAMDMIPPALTYPECTLASHPRVPEHCIQWAMNEFPKTHEGRHADGDRPEDIHWILEVSLKRANQYGIEGVNEKLTLGVVKNIIPTIASTNAIVAAACCNEAFKIATNVSYNLNNYMQYSGRLQPYTFTFEYEKKEDCHVCATQRPPLQYHVSSEMTLLQLIQRLGEDPSLQYKKPAISTESGVPLYMKLVTATHENLTKPLTQLIQSQDVLFITDPCMTQGQNLRLEVIFNSTPSSSSSTSTFSSSSSSSSSSS